MNKDGLANHMSQNKMISYGITSITMIYYWSFARLRYPVIELIYLNKYEPVIFDIWESLLASRERTTQTINWLHITCYWILKASFHYAVERLTVRSRWVLSSRDMDQDLSDRCDNWLTTRVNFAGEYQIYAIFLTLNFEASRLNEILGPFH